jgi:hypothetical protein
MRTANAKLRFEAEQKLVRFEHVIKLQMAEIAKLRAENKRYWTGSSAIRML